MAVVRESASLWFFGPRSLVLSDPRAVEPIPAIGALGYFNWQPTGAPCPPLPWMVSWPNDARRQPRAPAPPPRLPLLDGKGEG